MGLTVASPSVGDLIERCLNGENVAWSELFNKYKHSLKCYAEKVLRRRELFEQEGEEIALLVLESLWIDNYRRLRTYDTTRGSLLTFLYARVRAVIQELCRQKERRLFTSSFDVCEPLDCRGDLEIWVCLQDLLDQLTPQEARLVQESLEWIVEGQPTLSPANKWKLAQRVRKRITTLFREKDSGASSCSQKISAESFPQK